MHPVVIYLKVGNGLVLMVILPNRDIFMHSHTALFDRLFTCQADIHTLMVTLGEILISRTLEGAVSAFKWQFVLICGFGN